MPGLIKPIFAEPYKHIYNLLRQPHYATYHRLVSQLRYLPRFQPTTVRVHGWTLHVPDAASLLSTYREVFLHQIYAFRFPGERPRILDLGANIGLSVLAFKQQYPQAAITAFEADPRIFHYLQQNVHGNGYQDVELINKAAWYEDGEISFYSEGADAGRVVVAPEGPARVQVEALNLAAFMEGLPFDLIKMDIEGAETQVLPILLPYLSQVSYIFVEFHSWKGQPQGLVAVLSTLEAAGFRVSLQQVWGSQSPFMDRAVNSEGMDFQANIFGWREDTGPGEQAG